MRQTETPFTSLRRLRHLPVLEEFHPFALSLILGFLIGVEREYHHKKSATAFGVRTFPFVALTGTLAAYAHNTYLTLVIAGAVFALIVISYFFTARGRGKTADFGLTTEFAAVIVFCTGYLLVDNARLGALVGVATLALLVSREWLHRFIREKLKQSEITAAAVLIIAVFGIAPFLPDRALDPWQLFNPRRLVTLISIIGLIHFAGYAAIRMFGAKAGLALTGFLGGFISSTAVFLNIRSTLHENPRHEKTVLASGLFAITATLTELIAVLYVASPPLVFKLWRPMAAMIVTSGILGFFFLWRDNARVRGSDAGEPLDFKAVAKMGILLSLLIAVVDLGHRYFSHAGLWIISFASGLFELHGASLAVAVEQGKDTLSPDNAAAAILFAVAASFVSKFGILIVGGRDAFALKGSVALGSVSLAGFAVLLL